MTRVAMVVMISVAVLVRLPVNALGEERPDAAGWNCWTNRQG